MKNYLLLLFIAILFAMEKPLSAQKQTVEKAIIQRTTTLNYLLWLPENYKKEKTPDFPLLIFLHGSGERGDSINLVKRNGPPSFIENLPDFPFITVSPQCPANTRWNIEDLEAMLKQLQTKYRIDENRIYLTGLSMGGFGTWSWASMHPEHFAAIVPVCGGGDIQFAGNLKDIPVWAFHGESDNVVPAKRTVEMVEAVNIKGGSARMTIYPGVGHDSWINAYAEKDLYTWLLSHTKNDQKK